MALKTLLGSQTMRRVLVHFAARPHSTFHFRALERHLGVSRQSLKNVLDALEQEGLVRRAPAGRQVVYTAADHPRWVTLRELIRDLASPAEVVGDLLRGVPGVQAACIFGSAASGRMRSDSDVDVLVVEEHADAGAIGMAAMEAGMLLGREIDLKCYTPADLRAEASRSGTSYLKRVLAGPMDWAIGSPDLALAG